MQLSNNIKIFYQRYITKGACNMNIIFNQTISMLECVSIAKKHIENNIAKNSSGTKDINNQAKLLNRIAEYVHCRIGSLEMKL